MVWRSSHERLEDLGEVLGGVVGGPPLEATIGRSGVPGLCIFGWPKNLGQVELDGLSCLYNL